MSLMADITKYIVLLPAYHGFNLRTEAPPLRQLLPVYYQWGCLLSLITPRKSCWRQGNGREITWPESFWVGAGLDLPRLALALPHFPCQGQVLFSSLMQCGSLNSYFNCAATFLPIPSELRLLRASCRGSTCAQ